MTSKLFAQIAPPVLLITTLACIWFSYAPAQSGSFHFDDAPNLAGLGSIDSFDAAKDFVLSGKAGPLGRPISLASFLLQADSWPHDATSFLRANILLHLINMLLVTWLGIRIARAIGHSNQTANFAGIAGGTLWAAMPILAFTSLSVVQRMTSLSASFTLLGLIGFVAAYQLSHKKPWISLLAALAALGSCTMLATFSKENGALTPVFALVLTCLLPATDNRNFSRLLRISLWTPLLLIVGFLIYKIPDSSPVSRDFNVLERLSTQGIILWDYLRNAALPSSAAFGPFHDDQLALKPWYAIQGIVALAAWAAVLIAAVAFRRHSPLAAFAALWFLGGHLLESTSLPLELYFDHRNYMPLVGPCLAVTLFLASLKPDQQRLFWPLFVIYIGLQLAILNGVTRTVGKPLLAAELWNYHFPASPRAAQFASNLYARNGDMRTAQGIIDRAAAERPQDISLAIQRIQLRCARQGTDDMQDIMPQLPSILSTGSFTFGAVSALEDLARLSASQRCGEITPSIILQYTQLLMDNPAYAWQTPLTALHLMRSRQYTHPTGSDQIIEELSQAWMLDPQMEIGLDLVVALRNADRDCGAQAFLEQAIQNPPQEWDGPIRSKALSIYKQFADSFSGANCDQIKPASGFLETSTSTLSINQ